MTYADHWGFGKNWQDYRQHHLNEERIAEARDSLKKFLKVETLEGRSFLDIGSGSGLFSLAARSMGASPILSFDVDEDSMACTRALHAEVGSPEDWEVQVGSVLDPAFMAKVGRWDVVYSWGVLHHTGAMWSAVEAASKCLAPGGLFYLALYNETRAFGFHPDGRFGSSRLWWWEKRFYNALPRCGQWVVNSFAYGTMVLLYLLTLQNPYRVIRGHRGLRGMAWRTDIRDWLGGWPYEYAAPDAVFEFLAQSQGLELRNLATPGGLLNNEFLFKRPDSTVSTS